MKTLFNNKNKKFYFKNQKKNFTLKLMVDNNIKEVKHLLMEYKIYLNHYEYEAK